MLQIILQHGSNIFCNLNLREIDVSEVFDAVSRDAGTEVQKKIKLNKYRHKRDYYKTWRYILPLGLVSDDLTRMILATCDKNNGYDGWAKGQHILSGCFISSSTK